MKIIPAIDIIDGKCVRLTQGDYAQKKIYNENPLEVAQEFERAGLKHLHLVDLDGAKAGKVTNWNVAESICSKTALSVDFGGGIKQQQEIERLFDIGITQVNLGSIAVKNRALVYDWIDLFGPEKIILSADVKQEMIAISGWQETAGISVFDFVQQYLTKGLRYVTCTDIAVDGMLTGPSIPLYQKLITRFHDLQIIASGGVSSMDDLKKLKNTGVMGVIVGKAIYEGRIAVAELGMLENDNT